jgi:hypothetical protein
MIILFGCEKKFDFSTLPDEENISVNDTAYIELTPPFTGFSRISSVIVGGDQLMYVADKEANKIIQMNIAGARLGETTILHPTSVAQDSRLDLLVCGEMIAGSDTIGAIFRIHLAQVSVRLSQITAAHIDTVWKERSSPARRFVSLIVVSENQYIAARLGPNNSSPIDPDSRLLWFKKTDALITPISDLQTGVGAAITFINKPTGLVSFPNNKDFIVTQTSEGVSYGAIWMSYQNTSDFTGWIPKFDPTIITQRVDFISPNQFIQANGVTIDANREDVFILNAFTESAGYAVKKFDKKGKFKPESIHPRDVAPALREPVSGTFSDKILYVASPSHIYRFKLSTDFNR